MATDELVKSHPIPDAAYYIRSKATQKVLGLTSSDAVLMQDKADDDDGQKWIFTKRGEIDKKKGSYSIANLERQNVRLGFGSQSANARVEGKDDLVTWTVWVSKNNTFQFNTGNPVFVIEAGSSGSRVTLQDEEGTTHQQWEIIVVKDTAENANTTTGTVHAKISTGQKYFIRNWHNSLLLSIGNKSANSIATNEIYAGNQTQKKMDPKAPVGQIWSVNHKGDGSYEIYNTAARQYLSFADGKNTAYSDLIGSQEPTKWCLNSVGGFAWVITSPESKLCVGFPNPTPHDNDKAFLVPDIITQNKIWFFEDATDAMTSLADRITGIQVSRLSFTSAITPRNYRIRNVGRQLVLLSGPNQYVRNGQTWYSHYMSADAGSYNTWTLKEYGSVSKSYTWYSTYSGHYAYPSDGLLQETADQNMKWTFALGPSGHYYISIDGDTSSPRKVLGGVASGQKPVIVDLQEGNADQLWTLEAA